MTTQRFVCPFCGGMLFETGFPMMAAAELELAEITCGQHMLLKHPIRWRLNRHFRRALKEFRVRELVGDQS